MSEPEPPTPEGPAACAVRAAIAQGVRRLIAAEQEARRGGVETIHQMRVASRRLRSDLRTFGPLLESSWTDALRGELRWLGRVLGDVRELDVLLSCLRRDSGEDLDALGPLFAALCARQAAARGRLHAALDSGRYAALLGRLTTAARAPLLVAEADAPCREALPPLVAATWTKLARAARKLEPDDPDEAYHRARIRAKRTRYAAEAVAPALGKRRADAEAFARRATRVQDLLGEHQDAVTARAAVAELAALHPAAPAFQAAAARLLALQDEAIRAARGKFPKVWKKLDRKQRRRWFKA